MQEIIKEIIARRYGKVLLNEKIANYTTYKVGGKARAIVFPKNVTQLCDLVSYLREKEVKYFVLGRGSNVLFSDNIYDGIIIKLDYFDEIIYDNTLVKVGAGVSLMKLSRDTVKKGLQGLEFADGIPGSVGGAIFMNAGSYGEDMSMIVHDVTVLRASGDIEVLTGEQMKFSYRTSIMQVRLKDIIIGATLKLKELDEEKLEEMVHERRLKRKQSQPLEFPSAGSVFRNPKGMFAGKLIESSSLKGYTVGKAKISEKHANFIINTGNAKATDIKKIIDYVKLKVKDKHDVTLKVEQRLVNWEE